MSFERRKVRVGRVIADKMDKTVVVTIDRKRPHRLYKKAVRRRSRFNAHDEQNEARIGDLVRIMETRPLSKTKRWRVTDIIAREDIAEIQPEEIEVDAYEAETPEPMAGDIAAETAAALATAEPEPVAEEAVEPVAVAEPEPEPAEVQEETETPPVATTDDSEDEAEDGEQPVSEEDRSAEEANDEKKE
jgi:small subunit ribosomal protein S17